MNSLVPWREAGSPDRAVRQQLARIDAIYQATEAAARRGNAAYLRVTREAVRTLEQIHWQLATGVLPGEQRRQLARQAEAAITHHRRLLAEASARAQQEVAAAGGRSGRPGILDRFAAELAD